VDLSKRKPQQRERIEQGHIANLLASIGAKVYILGTTRIWACPNCKERLPASHMTTRQTPGLADVYAFLPVPTFPSKLRPPFLVPPGAVWTEVKANGGKPSEAQKLFAALCQTRGIAHVIGGVSEVMNFLIDGGWLSEVNRR